MVSFKHRFYSWFIASILVFCGAQTALAADFSLYLAVEGQPHHCSVSFTDGLQSETVTTLTHRLSWTDDPLAPAVRLDVCIAGNQFSTSSQPPTGSSASWVSIDAQNKSFELSVPLSHFGIVSPVSQASRAILQVSDGINQDIMGLQPMIQVFPMAFSLSGLESIPLWGGGLLGVALIGVWALRRRFETVARHSGVISVVLVLVSVPWLSHSVEAALQYMWRQQHLLATDPLGDAVAPLPDLYQLYADVDATAQLHLRVDVKVDSGGVLPPVPPVVTGDLRLLSGQPAAIEEGSAWSYLVLAEDDQGEYFSYELLEAPAGVTVNAAGYLTWDSAVVGQHPLRVKITNPAAQSGEIHLVLPVVPRGTVANLPKAPRFVSVPPYALNLGDHFSYSVSVNDPQNSPIQLTLVQAPVGASLNNGQLSWQADRAGYHAVTLRATNGLGLSSEQTFLLAVDDALVGDAVEARAPVQPTTMIPPFYQQVEFLYRDADPIQKAVDQSAMRPEALGVIRGKVSLRDGSPATGVKVYVHQHAAYGYVLTDANGEYSLAVNAGELYTVSVEKTGYLPLQRKVKTYWSEFSFVDNLVLTPLSEVATTIRLQAAEGQWFSGATTTDRDGSRQVSMYFPANLQAKMHLPNDTEQTLNSLTVRSSEFTVGETGLEAMPGRLPGNIGYTFAAEFSVDEALAAGATRVEFNQPIRTYVDNFLNIPIGIVVPLGSYSYEKSAWVGERSGRVIKILGVDSAGRAEIQLGEASIAAPLSDLLAQGFDEAELRLLASRFAPGQSVWRVEIHHFSPWDCNFPWGPPPNTPPPPSDPPSGPDKPDPEECDGTSCEPEAPPEDCSKSGCEIRPITGTLGEHVAVDGTGLHLSYFNRTAYKDPNPIAQTEVTPAKNTPANREDKSEEKRKLKPNQLYIPLMQKEEVVPANLQRIHVLVDIGGRRYKYSYAPRPNSHMIFSWNGQRWNQAVNYALATVTIEYEYGAILYGSREENERAWNRTYANMVSSSNGGSGGGGSGGGSAVGMLDLYVGQWEPRTFKISRSWSGLKVFVPWSTAPTVRPTQTTSLLNSHNAGSWSIDQVHQYDRSTQTLYLGSGQIERGDAKYIGHYTLQTLTTAEVANVVRGSSFYSVIAEDGRWYQLQADHLYRFTPDGRSERVSCVQNCLSLDELEQDQQYPIEEIMGIQGIAAGHAGELLLFDNRQVYAMAGNGLVTRLMGAKIDQPIYEAHAGGNLADARRVQFNDIQGIMASRHGGYFVQLANKLYQLTPEHRLYELTGINLAGYTLLGESVTGMPVFYRNINWSYDYKVVAPRFPTVLDQQMVLVPNKAGSEIYEFDINGLHTRTLHPITGAALQTFSYDSHGRLSQLQDLNGNVTRLQRDAAGNLVKIIAPLGQETTLSTDSNGLLSQITDRQGQHRFEYENGLLIKHNKPNGTENQYRYDDRQRLIEDRDQTGIVWQFERYGNQIKQIDRSGVETQIKVSGNQRLYTYADGARTLIEGNSQQRKITSTQPSGKTLTTVQDYQFDKRFGSGARQPQAVRSALGSAYHSETITQTDSNDPFSVTRYQSSSTVNGRSVYSDFNKATMTVTSGSAGVESRTTVDQYMRPLSVEQDGLAKVDIGYDAQGRVTRIQASDGLETLENRYSYHSSGELKTVRNPLGQEMHFSYTPQGWLQQQTLPDSRTIQYQYDGNGRMTTMTVPGGAVHRFDYNRLGDTTAYHPPLSTQTQYVYDGASRLQQVIRPSGERLNLVYDAATSRLNQVQLPEGSIDYRYDNNNRLSALEGGEVNLGFGYEDNGQVNRLDFAGAVNKNVHLSYNSRFDLNTIQPQGGAEIQYDYDTERRIYRIDQLRMSYDATTGLPKYNEAGYVSQHDQYNAFAQRTQTLTTSPQRYYDSRQLEPVLQAFEAMRRAAQADFATYTFPKRERLIAAGITPYSVDDLREAALSNVDWLFDYAWHELLQKLNNFEAYEEEAALVDYLDRYFPNSVFTLNLFEYSEESFAICPPMFSLRSVEDGGDMLCYTRFDYLRTPANKALYSDFKAKLSALYREHIVDLPELNVAYSANYRYDALGRILHQQQLVGNTLGGFESERHDYRYDAAGRLKTADSWEFEYDANGNRVKSTQDGFLETLATYDTEDRLLSFGNRTYTYDANGARQTQTENGTETRYRYDNLGALKSVTKSGQAVDYITDATGRRVGRKVNGSVESYFTYQDSLRPIAQYNADGSIRWTIVYAERMNVPSLLISSNGTRYRVVSDHLGSVRLIINTLNGQIVQRMDYDVWGKVTYDSNPNFQPFGFAGGLYDSATELVRFGARDYDPHVGRWLSKDPIGFAGGDSNLYGYVLQDPVNWVDPSGLKTVVTIWHPGGWGSSSFGHVSTSINGKTYTFAPNGMNVLPTTEYHEKNNFRLGVGTVLNLTAKEEVKLEACMNSSKREYDVLTNNCGTLIQNCLMGVRGLSNNLEWSFFPVSIGNALLDSNLFDGIEFYEPSVPAKGSSAPWAR